MEIPQVCTLTFSTLQVILSYFAIVGSDLTRAIHRHHFLSWVPYLRGKETLCVFSQETVLLRVTSRKWLTDLCPALAGTAAWHQTSYLLLSLSQPLWQRLELVFSLALVYGLPRAKASSPFHMDPVHWCSFEREMVNCCLLFNGSDF